MSERSAWEVEAAWERFLAQYKDDQTIGLLESFKPELVAWLETELAARPQEPTASQPVRELVAKARLDEATNWHQFGKDHDDDGWCCKRENELRNELEAALTPQASQPLQALVAEWHWRANNVGFKGACDANQFRAGDIEQCADELEAALSQQASQPPEAQDPILMPNGSFTERVREVVLAPSFCGKPGHFKFQQNGSSCLMCQENERAFQRGQQDMAEKAGQLREACEFAIGAIEDAIGLEDGLDGAEGQAVLKMLRNALAAAVEPPQEPKP